MLSLQLCAKGFVKSAMVTMNAFCIILAILLMGISLTDIQIVNQYADEGEYTAGTVAANAVVLGVCLLLVFVAGYGCFGAIKENEKYLYIYTVLLLVMVVLELMLAVFTAVQRYGLEVRVIDWIRTDFYRNLTEEEAPEHDKHWDRLQFTFMCCGVDGPDDYTALGLPVSLSCCRTAYSLKTHQGRQKHYDLCLKEKSYEEDGCEDEILYALRESGDFLLCLAVIALIFEGSGMMMAMWLTNYLKNEVKIYKETLRY